MSPVFRAVLALLLLSAAAWADPAPTRVQHADWARGPIYELNTRQFTPEGTFRAILPRIEELRALGVRTIWFMPIHPIGRQNRKGDLGSPYSVQDYYGINPEFGTLDDFRAVVEALHAAGMHVIIDLVANHTAWDNSLATDHPEWYVHDSQGHFVPPVPDWADVIQLDYAQAGLRTYMIDMMAYWIRDVGVDGFRCDYAAKVPTDFWDEARQRLDAIRPVFMLAEAEKPEVLEYAFDSDYGSEYFRLFIDIAAGRTPAVALGGLLASDTERYPAGSWRLQFTTNHDQNSWLDSDIHLFGEAGSRAFAVLSFTLPGLPLIYDGQEVGDPHKLAFFSHDPILWHPDPRRAFYQSLCQVYESLPALHDDGVCTVIHSNRDDRVFSFTRQSETDEVLVVTNLSSAAVQATLPWASDRPLHDLLNGGHARARGGSLTVSLAPWEYHVYQARP